MNLPAYDTGQVFTHLTAIAITISISTIGVIAFTLVHNTLVVIIPTIDGIDHTKRIG